MKKLVLAVALLVSSISHAADFAGMTGMVITDQTVENDGVPYPKEIYTVYIPNDPSEHGVALSYVTYKKPGKHSSFLELTDKNGKKIDRCTFDTIDAKTPEVNVFSCDWDGSQPDGGITFTVYDKFEGSQEKLGEFILPAAAKKTGKYLNSSTSPIGDTSSPNWGNDKIDTTAGAGYLTEAERNVILEINRLRADPAAYARRVLVPLRALYHGDLLEYPGETPISTNEGRDALEECIRELGETKALPPLSPEKGLVLAARDQARDQARTGATGHEGSDGSTVTTRLNRYGKWGSSAGENIDYGNRDARRIVTALLIDDGVSDRGHRKNLLDRRFKLVGVEVGPHPEYDSMCVMDFAGTYESK